MYVCLCNAISDKAIRNVIRKHHPQSFQELRTFIPVGNECGKCIRQARNILNEEIQEIELFINSATKVA